MKTSDTKKKGPVARSHQPSTLDQKYFLVGSTGIVGDTERRRHGRYGACHGGQEDGGLAAGSISVTRPGSAASCPTLDEVRALVGE